MSHIYWEKHEILRPADSYINHADGRVFLMEDDGFGNKRRIVIGHATSETTMHPNDTYKLLYPELWFEYYGEKALPEEELHIGMYALLLGIGYTAGIYPVLQEVYGPQYANAIMDYAMYSIMNQTGLPESFADKMSCEVLFSKEAYSDSWYSDMFRFYMFEQDNQRFRTEWLKECAKRGMTKVWITINSSDNSGSGDSGLNEKENVKSCTDSNIVNYIWVLNATDGTPITYLIHNGSMVDGGIFQEVTDILTAAGIEIEGVILGWGSCVYEVFQMLNESKYPFAVKLPSNTRGYMDMMDRYGGKIKWNVRYLVNSDGLFGATSEQQVFSGYPETAWIGLYYDGVNGSKQSVALMKKVHKAKDMIEQSILNHSDPSVPEDLAPYIAVEKNGSEWTVEIQHEALQKKFDEEGFYAIACSENLGAREMNRLYHLSDTSEEQFMVMRSQPGFDANSFIKSNASANRFAVCFITSIIEQKLGAACKKIQYHYDEMLENAEDIMLILGTDGLYAWTDNLTEQQRELLGEFNVFPEYFKAFAANVNRRRKSPIDNQVHQLPPDGGKKGSGGQPDPKNAEENAESKRKPGRPKGNKNRNTLEREALQQDQPELGKRKPGRAKGSKNKPKTEES